MGDELQAEGGTGQPTSGLGGLVVPLGVHIKEFDAERTRRLEREIEHLREVHTLQREADQVALQKALDAAQAMAEKHNDLIRAAEKKDEGYATKLEFSRLENWQAKITGGMIVIAAIGVANFVKVWTGYQEKEYHEYGQQAVAPRG